MAAWVGAIFVEDVAVGRGFGGVEDTVDVDRARASGWAKQGFRGWDEGSGGGRGVPDANAALVGFCALGGVVDNEVRRVLSSKSAEVEEGFALLVI